MSETPLDQAVRDVTQRSPYVVATVRADTDEAARQERRLSEALAGRGVMLLAATVEGSPTWDDDADVKSSFLLDVWRQSDVPVLWLDVDTDVAGLADLAPVAESDFAVHDRSRRHGADPGAGPDLASTFLWFAKSTAAEDLLTTWADRCAGEPTTADGVHLAKAWEEVTTRRDLRTVWVSAGAAGVRGTEAMRGDALPHARSLFDRRSHPYYIVAAEFRESSAGVWSMHALCHVLNSAGYEAYVVGSTTLNPRWDTPQLTQQQADLHAAAGLEPIAVYPEIITGNPLNVATVARYVLNVPGFFTGSPMEESPDDLLFYYSAQFIGDRDPEDVDFLLTPTIDPRLFRPDPTRMRDKVLIYQNRFPRESIDLSLFPPGAELLTMSNPLPLPELARLLQSATVLYSYELSGTCTMAMACGCPVVYRPEGGLTELPSTFLFGDRGAAMSDEVGGLERATRTVGEVPGIIAGIEEAYWEQLAVFVRKTQRAAEQRRRPA